MAGIFAARLRNPLLLDEVSCRSHTILYEGPVPALELADITGLLDSY
jgi:hypothetical protein